MIPDIATPASIIDDPDFGVKSFVLVSDNIDVIETRYNEYLNSTQKVSNFYKDKYNTKFYEIDGSLEIEEITQNIKQILKKS